MTRNPIRRLVLLFLLLPLSPIRAEEPTLRDLLRDALYTEEVTRDPEKAAKQYEDLLARHDEQKQFAASALFRLAEVRRKQDRKDDAIKLYQRLITEFPGAETETKLAKENLAALGGKMPEAGGAVQSMDDYEKGKLAELEAKAKSSPDVLLDSNELSTAASQGLSKIVRRMLEAGCDPYGGDALKNAADTGNLEIVKLLTESKAPVPDEIASVAILTAIQKDRFTILEYLLNKGLKPGVIDGTFGKTPVFVQAVLENRFKGAEILLQHRADVNAMVASNHSGAFVPCGTTLHLVVANQFGKLEGVEWLLRNGAKPDLADPWYGLTPLHYAAMSDRPEAVEVIGKLLAAGADPNHRSDDRVINDDFKNNFLRGSTPLETAIAFSGARLDKTKLFLKQGAKPTSNGSKLAKALAWAMTDQSGADALELVGVLGNGGFPMIDPYLMETALKSKNRKIIEALLKHGADPNTKDDEGNTLLAQACIAGDADRVQWLLKNGVDPKQPGLLGKLITRGPDTMPMIQLLLEAGADPNAVDSTKVPPIVQVFDWDLKNLDDANQKSAKHWKQVELIQLLLKHGADPNTTYGEFARGKATVQRDGTIQYGANPFVEDPRKSESYPSSLLMKVVELEDKQNMRDVNLIKILLDAGAKPTHEFPEIFDFVAKGDDSLPIAKALLPFRPKTLNLNPTGYFLNWNPEVERLFLDEILNPALAAKGGIHFVLAEQGGCKTLLEEGQPILDTAELLLNVLPSVLTPSPSDPFGYSMDLSRKMREPVFTLVRRVEDGKWSREPIDWKGDGPLPKLLAGDIIEFTWGPVLSNSDGRLADCLRWHFRKRVSFAVTVEIGGESRKIKLRGDLLSYDPTKNEAPWLSVGHLAELFLPGAIDEERSGLAGPAIVTVRRKNGSEIKVDVSAGELAFGIQMEPEDRLVLPDPGSVIRKADRSARPVLLHTPGIWAGRIYWPLTSTQNSGEDSSVMPTLVEVLTDAYSSCNSQYISIGFENKEGGIPEMSRLVERGILPIVPPHPDFSKIRIKRSDEHGRERLILVNLAEAINTCSEKTTAGEARKKDVSLLPGDVIELPLKADLVDTPWNGFSQEEERFFTKILNGTVRAMMSNGVVKPMEISYHQPDWRQTPHGLIPMPPKEGITSGRRCGFVGGQMPLRLTRDGRNLGVTCTNPILRDGDGIEDN